MRLTGASVGGDSKATVIWRTDGVSGEAGGAHLRHRYKRRVLKVVNKKFYT